jgi:hypothetical protein
LVLLRLEMYIEVVSSFPLKCYTSSLDSRFNSYEVFKISGDLWACCQPLPM